MLFIKKKKLILSVYETKEQELIWQMVMLEHLISPGVILAGQNGPGATNLVTGIAQAAAAFSPVVSIAGSFSTKDKVQDAFQGIDQQSLFNPITKKTWTITETKKIPKIFSKAFNLAMSPRRGPVQLNLPRNILSRVQQSLILIKMTNPIKLTTFLKEKKRY